MTTLAISRHCRNWLDHTNSWVVVSLGALLALLAGAAALTLVPARSRAVAMELPPATTARQVALVAATSGEAATQMRAIGPKAELLNASLPFAQGPVLSAKPFAASGTTLDEQRALLCLTQAIYYEAGFEPLNGRRAVAQVVLNRMRHPAFPKSICGVVYQHSTNGICQFSFVCDGALNHAPAARAWAESRRIAEAALAGYVEKSVGSATHYHADYVAPRWAPLLAKISQIGQHIFYRWPGAWGQPAAFTGRYIGEPSDPLSLRPHVIAAVARIDPASEVTATELASAGPPVPRADNDVGGLLDPSKGWTLSIPGPGDADTSATRLIAQQEGRKAAPGAPVKVASAAESGGGTAPGVPASR